MSVLKKESINITLKFYPEEDGINKFLENIKLFGNILEENKNIFGSLIEFDQNLVKSWLNNRNFISELLFRKTRDGSTLDAFHNKCDNKGITIVFIETTKGYKFGGYTVLLWNKSGNSKKDKSTFIFSFIHKKNILKEIAMIPFFVVINMVPHSDGVIPKYIKMEH